jgi:uncharacterized membrane protein YhhN
MTDAPAPSANNSRILFIAGAVLALSHLANDWIHLDQPWGPAWKASGIVVLGLYALSQRAYVVGLGLLLSSVGDVLLEVAGFTGDKSWFIGGMGAFGAAHICYTFAFTTIIRREGINRGGWPFAVAVLAASIALGVWFAPGQAEANFTVPATAYQLIISVMVITAFMSKAPLLARLGAVIFMLSDTLIAVGMFAKMEVPTGSVWLTYAAAQIMLAWALSRRA